ncbi:hypothetical protein NXS19_011179 [Fusarium pseudograminearum]|nr:hypothetical protein NXS19_011179 [Fusarium pseudograminearum]
MTAMVHHNNMKKAIEATRDEPTPTPTMSETLHSLHQKVSALVQKLSAIGADETMPPWAKQQLHEATLDARSIQEALGHICHVARADSSEIEIEITPPPTVHPTPDRVLTSTKSTPSIIRPTTSEDSNVSVTVQDHTSQHARAPITKRRIVHKVYPETATASVAESQSPPLVTPPTRSDGFNVFDTVQDKPSQPCARVTKSSTTRQAHLETVTATSGPTLRACDMGETLVANLDKIVTQDGFQNEVTLQVQKYDNTNTEANQLGACFIFKSTSARDRFKWPDFGIQQKPPTANEAEKWLNHVIKNPPQHTISHYVGHANHIEFQGRLNPGPHVLSNDALGDIHKPYFHIGADKSANRFHVEDLSCLHEKEPRHGLRSANQVLLGIKIWVLIATRHTTKFRKFIDKHWDTERCGSAVSHLELLVSPAQLRKEGIDFTIQVGYPGNLIVTHPCQYHMVINQGACIAQSINFILPGDSIECDKQLRCSQDGLAPYADELGMPMVSISQPKKCLQSADHKKGLKRAADTDTHIAPKIKKTKKGIYRPQELSHLSQVLKELHKKDLVFQSPQLDSMQSVDERVYRFVCAIASRETVRMFFVMVAAWNKHVHSSNPPQQIGTEPVLRRVMLIKAIEGEGALITFISKHNQLHLHKEYLKKKREGYRILCEMREEVRQKAGWSKSLLEYHLEIGKRFLKLSHGKEGILPFLSCYPQKDFDVRLSNSTWFDDEQVEQMKRLLNTPYTTALLLAGKSLEQAVETLQPLELGFHVDDVSWEELKEDEVITKLELVANHALGASS